MREETFLGGDEVRKEAQSGVDDIDVFYTMYPAANVAGKTK